MKPALDVVGIGSMVVDRLHRAPRILREDEKGILRPLEGGGPVQQAVGGVVLNHLGWASVLGLRPGIFGLQADDEAGRFLRAGMDRLGIERHLSLAGSASSVAEIFVDDGGGRSIYMAPGATSETTPEHVREHHGDFLRRGARVSTEVSQLPLATTREVLRMAREAGIPTVVDLDVPPSDALATLGDEATLHDVLALADVLKPAKAALRELAAGPASADALELARALRARFGNTAVVVTDGAAGCAVSAEGFEGRIDAPRPRDVADTTGAGDAFLGGLLAALHHRLDWKAAGALANACGAACVEQLGAFPEDPAGARARVLELYRGPAIELAPLRTASSADAQVVAALRVLDVAAEEVAALARRHDGRALLGAAELVERVLRERGRVHVTGVGKSGHVAHYASALMASTGTPATYLDALEAMHGSLGQVVAEDVVFTISNSGETEELRRVAEAVRKHGARVVAVVGEADSWLARHADVVLEAGVTREGGPLGLEPRASFAAQSMVLAALAALLQERSGFTRADYAVLHPAGALGRRARG